MRLYHYNKLTNSKIYNKTMQYIPCPSTRSLLMSLSLMGLLCVGCNRGDRANDDVSQADDLYVELLSTYKAYADSLEQIPVTDTTGRVAAIEERFEKQMHRINWKYPMDTDHYLSQSQNDTLWSYTQRYTHARALHRHQPAQPDTTLSQPDSIAVPQAL